jgi:hypothetical protein
VVLFLSRHCEAVSNITNRAEVMSLCFQLSAFCLYWLARSRSGVSSAALLGASCGLALLAALSKESGFMIMPINMALDFALSGGLDWPLLQMLLHPLLRRALRAPPRPAVSSKRPPTGKPASSASSLSAWKLDPACPRRLAVGLVFVVAFLAVRLYIQVISSRRPSPEKKKKRKKK